MWLLWWTGRRRPGDPAPEDTSHVWDGDLTEYNKPLPKWWINLFYITIVFSIGYIAWYGGLGVVPGYAKWSSTGEHDEVKAVQDKKLEATFAPFAGQSIDQLAQIRRRWHWAARSSTTPAPPAMARRARAPSAIPTSPTTSGIGAARRTSCCRRCWTVAKA